jgi:hypothetical protein
MSKRRNNPPRRIVDPRGHRIPLFVRFCEAFVENLSQILRVALVVGGVYLAHSLVDLRDAMNGAPEVPASAAVAETPETLPAQDAAPFESEVIQLAEDCTRTEYWTRHYDKCFPDGSAIYPRPDPKALDDASFIMGDRAVMVASLDSQ